MYSPQGYYDEAADSEVIMTYFDPVQCMPLPITRNALEERRIAIWLSWFLGTWSDNYGNLIHVEGNVAKCRHLYYRVASVARKKVVDSGMIYFDMDTYTIHLDCKFELDTEFSDDLTVRWRPVNPGSPTFPLWTHIERLDRCAKWHVLNDIEVSRNSNVERYLMNKRKEMVERLPRDGRSDGTGAVRDNAVSGREQLHNRTMEGEPPRKEEPVVPPAAAPSVSSGSGWGATNGNTEAPKVASEAALDWRNAPDTKPDKPLEPMEPRRGGRERWNHRWNGYHYGDAPSRGRRGWSSRK